jgi:hypothetical protein
MDALDAPLFQTLKTLPAFPFARLCRPDRKSIVRSRKAFFAERALPNFTYAFAERFDSKAYEQALNAVADRIATLPASEPVRGIYLEKIEENRSRLALVLAIQRGDDEAVTALADHLFGQAAQSASELADEFTDLLARSHELHLHRNIIDGPCFATMVQATLDHYGLTHWSIRATRGTSVAVCHSSEKEDAIVKIPKTFASTRARAARLLTHEIEVHALRRENGMNSPIALLGRGLANYLATDEGLAVAMQQKLRSEATIDPGFWDMWVTTLTKTQGFIDTFDQVFTARRAFNLNMKVQDAETEARDTTWRLLFRASRGLHTPGKAGLGFRRDHIYRSGLLHVRQAFDTYGEANILPTLFAGHAGIHHIPLLRSLNITGRTPDFVGKHIVRDILKQKRETKPLIEESEAEEAADES